MFLHRSGILTLRVLSTLEFNVRILTVNVKSGMRGAGGIEHGEGITWYVQFASSL